MEMTTNAAQTSVKNSEPSVSWFGVPGNYLDTINTGCAVCIRDWVHGPHSGPHSPGYERHVTVLLDNISISSFSTIQSSHENVQGQKNVCSQTKFRDLRCYQVIFSWRSWNVKNTADIKVSTESQLSFRKIDILRTHIQSNNDGKIRPVHSHHWGKRASQQSPQQECY